MHEVISAFLDNEPFDAQELSGVLASDEGRRLLLDLIALRNVVQPVFEINVRHRTTARRRGRYAIAAAVVAMLSGAFVLGHLSAGSADRTAVVSTDAAPAPTGEFKFEPGVNWRENPPAGGG